MDCLIKAPSRCRIPAYLARHFSVLNTKALVVKALELSSAALSPVRDNTQLKSIIDHAVLY